MVLLTTLQIAKAAIGVAAVSLLLSATVVTAAEPEPAVKRLAVADPARILFVGNSYLYYGDSLHNHVRRMAIAAGIHEQTTLKYKSVTISGGALADHEIENYLKLGKLRVKDGFQVVVLQGGSAAPLSDKRRKEFLETVREFDKEIRDRGGVTALYMTHAYVKPHKKFAPGMIDDISRLYIEAGNAVGALIIPVGLGFEEAYKRRPDLQLHKSFDGSHPDLIGTYLAACIVYASLYSKPATGNPYDYYGKIDKETVAFLQKVADDTVAKFYGR